MSTQRRHGSRTSHNEVACDWTMEEAPRQHSAIRLDNITIHRKGAGPRPLSFYNTYFVINVLELMLRNTLDIHIVLFYHLRCI